jgi:hypothetical protein
MATVSSEVQDILDQVKGTRGYRTVRTRKGVQVLGPNDTSSCISNTASRSKARSSILGRLRREVFWTPELYAQQQEADRKKRLEQALDVNHPHTDRTGMNPTPTGAVNDRARHADCVDTLLDDLDANAWLLAAQILELARPQGTRGTHDGQPGWEWNGDLFTVMRELWPDVPKSRTHPQSMRLQTTVIPHLRHTKRLIALRSDDQDSSVVWWVVDDEEPRKVAPGGDAAATASAEGPRSVKLHVCEMPTVVDGQPCVFTDTSPHSVRMHRTQCGDAPHPHEGVFECTADPACPAVRGTRKSMNSHLERHHGYKICACDRAWPSRSAFAQHARWNHSRTTHKGAVPVPVPAQATAPAPAGDLPIDPQEIGTYVAGVFAANTELTEQVRRLTAENEELRNERKELRRRLARVERAFKK